eukprot:7966406-Lingulodinium_polyedra.AAC.1
MSCSKSEFGKLSARPPPPGLGKPYTESLGGYDGGMLSGLGCVPFRRPSVGSPAAVWNGG